MTNLSQLAAQVESKQQNQAWAAHKAEFAALEAEQETAAYMAEMEAEQALIQAAEGEMIAAEMAAPSDVAATVAPTMTTEVPESVLITPERLQAILMDGGYATVSVKNVLTGKHVTLQVLGRKRKPGGWISRATALGRVGLSQANCLEVRDPDRDYPNNYVGRWYKDGGGWKPGQDADVIRAKTAHVVLYWALAGGAMWETAEVRVSTRCRSCGRKLTHPESIDGMIGPECKGKATVGQAAPHVAPASA